MNIAVWGYSLCGVVWCRTLRVKVIRRKNAKVADLFTFQTGQQIRTDCEMILTKGSLMDFYSILFYVSLILGRSMKERLN